MGVAKTGQRGIAVKPGNAAETAREIDIMLCAVQRGRERNNRIHPVILTESNDPDFPKAAFYRQFEKIDARQCKEAKVGYRERSAVKQVSVIANIASINARSWPRQHRCSGNSPVYYFLQQYPGNKMSIADLRKEYSRASLSEADVDPDPIKQFSTWFSDAIAAQVPEANAMSVSTVGGNGRPSSRILLIKDVDQRGFTWFTNYDSRKGHELTQNAYAALLFYWIELERQVRIEGRVERISDAENDSYFQSRPLKSRLGAIASAQSRPVESRELLEAQFAQAERQHGEQPQRPAHWGGYRLLPDYIEFWQGRPSRLHDRIAYSLQADGSWKRQRLQP